MGTRLHKLQAHTHMHAHITRVHKRVCTRALTHSLLSLCFLDHPFQVNSPGWADSTQQKLRPGLAGSDGVGGAGVRLSPGMTRHLSRSGFFAMNFKKKKIFFFNWSIVLPWWLRWQRICLQCGRPEFNPWVGKIPWRRERQATPVFCLENSMDRGAWWSIVPRVARSWTQLSS